MPWHERWTIDSWCLSTWTIEVAILRACRRRKERVGETVYPDQLEAHIPKYLGPDLADPVSLEKPGLIVEKIVL
jgi:hypothetical protein